MEKRRYLLALAAMLVLAMSIFTGCAGAGDDVAADDAAMEMTDDAMADDAMEAAE